MPENRSTRIDRPVSRFHHVASRPPVMVSSPWPSPRNTGPEFTGGVCRSGVAVIVTVGVRFAPDRANRRTFRWRRGAAGRRWGRAQ